MDLNDKETYSNLPGTLFLEFDIEGHQKDIENMFPAVAFFNATKSISQPFRYLLKSEKNKNIQFQDLKQLLEDFKNKKIKSYRKSGKLPFDNDKRLIKEVVRNNYIEQVIENEKDVFVYFYQNDNPQCGVFDPIFQHLAIIMQYNFNIQFVKINQSENELPSIQIDKFPTTIFYPKNDKRGIQIIVRDLQQLLIMLKKHTSYEWVEPINLEESEEEKDDDINYDSENDDDSQDQNQQQRQIYKDDIKKIKNKKIHKFQDKNINGDL